MEKILTVSDVASLLKMSKAKIYLMINKKLIPHLKIGKNVRVLESDLIKWIDACHIQGRPF